MAKTYYLPLLKFWKPGSPGRLTDWSSSGSSSPRPLPRERPRARPSSIMLSNTSSKQWKSHETTVWMILWNNLSTMNSDLTVISGTFLCYQTTPSFPVYPTNSNRMKNNYIEIFKTKSTDLSSLRQVLVLFPFLPLKQTQYTINHNRK
jgi:hypothetical protein